MSFHAVNLLIAVLVSALLSWGISTLDANPLNGAIGIGSFVFFASSLACAVGLDYEDQRTGVSVKLVGWTAFIAALLLNLFFAITGYSATGYIITCGIAYLLFILVANATFSAAQS